MGDEREVMKIRQAAQYLGVSVDTLYKYANSKRVPAFKIGNRWRFTRAALNRWMESEMTKGAAPGGDSSRL